MTAPRRENVSPKAKDIIKRIYSLNAVGCCWHVVLDDDNWDSIPFCKEWATENAGAGSEFPCETKGACQELAGLDVTASILKRARDLAHQELREARCH